MNHEPSTINHQPSTILVCPESGYHYELSTIHHQPSTINQLRCLDLDEEAPLPPELTQGTKTYDELKR
jgi:UDP-2-acetamido-3-amino-2,3-dideoxy-glucuronate N-acetyltransferase